MTNGVTVKRKLHVRCGRRNRRQMPSGEKPKGPAGRISRISRLMALAIRFDQLIRDGVVADQVELARLGQVSRARLTQIMNLLNLAPEIQEALLHLSSTSHPPHRLSERHLRNVTATLCWSNQRRILKVEKLGF